MRILLAALAAAVLMAPAAFAGPSIVGDMQDPTWTPDDPAYDLTLQVNGVYELTKTLPAGDYLYKAVDGDLWGLEFPGNNQAFTFGSEDDVTWYVNLGATVGVKEGDEYVFHSMNPPIVCGDFMSELGGSDWDQTNETLTVMSDTDDDGIWEWTSVIPAGSYNFKVVLNNNWDQDTHPPSLNYIFGSNGTTEILFRYHMQDNTTEVFSEAAPSVVLATALGSTGPIRVVFSKDVETITAETPGNYSVVDGSAGVYTVVTAVQDIGDAAIVLLTTSPAALPAGETYTVTVTGVEDLEGQEVDPDNNTGCFYTNEVTFEVNMQLYVDENGVPLSVNIQGDTAPLTWDACMGSAALNDGIPPDTSAADTVYTTQEYFSIPYVCDDGPADRVVKYKYLVDCTIWEGDFEFGHITTLSAGNVPWTESVWWNDTAPGDLTTCDVGVLFRVTHPDPGWISETDTLAVRGSELPLDWEDPDEWLLNDDGMFGDETADDGIYSVEVLFPAGTNRNLGYKYAKNGEFECSEFPNRSLVLDDVDGCIPGSGPMVVLDLWNWCDPVAGVSENKQEKSWGEIKNMFRAKK
jgi:hypothetical protein